MESSLPAVHGMDNHKVTVVVYDVDVAATKEKVSKQVAVDVLPTNKGDHPPDIPPPPYDETFKDEGSYSFAVSCHNFLYRTIYECEYRFNIVNAKLIAVGLLVFLIAVRGAFHLFTGLPPSCVCQIDSDRQLRHNHCPVESLLVGGKSNAEHQWTPDDCSVHDYTDPSLRNCFRNRGINYVKFVGDSRIRTLYQSYISQFNCQKSVDACTAQTRMCSFSSVSLGVMAAFHHANCSMAKEMHSIDAGSETLPTLIVAGNAAWSILKSDGEAHGLEEYREFLHALQCPMRKLAKKGVQILWAQQEPVMERRLCPKNRALTNERIDQYNDLAATMLKDANVHIWHSFKSIARFGKVSTCFNGYDYKYTSEVRKQDTKLLNNLYCNGYTNDTTCSCCNTLYPAVDPLSNLQLSTLFVLAAILTATLVALAVGAKRAYLATSPAHVVLLALGKMALVVAFVFFCDRTAFFAKSAKEFTALTFWLPVSLTLVFGSMCAGSAATVDLLHRAMLDEFKGWIQVVLLMYNVTGAGQYLPIYMIMRVLVSSYVLMVGYEIYIYFWRGGQPSFQHYFQALFELNFTAVVLCFVMGQNYQFYAIVPLVTFWYSLFYGVIAIRPIITADTPRDETFLLTQLTLVLKYSLLFTLTFAANMYEGVFQKVFLFPLWRGLFAVDDNVAAWRSQFTVDRYTAFAGLLVTGIFTLSTHRPAALPNRLSRCLGALCGVAGMSGYALFALSCEYKKECEEMHAYVAAVPVLSYVALRWAMAPTMFSTCFAWLGTMWVELLVLQYHVFMAGDGKGVLALLPGCPMTNIALTVFVLVCAADELRGITVALKNYAVPSNWRFAVVNLFILLLVLVPVNIFSFL